MAKHLLCKARLCMLFFAFLSTSAIYAQGDPQLQWVFNGVNITAAGGNNNGRAIAVDAAGNRYVTGRFSKTADFDPSANAADLTSAGGDDIFIAKYNANGGFIWAKSIGGWNNDVPNSIVLDGSGGVYIAGFFMETADFDPSAATANLVSAGGEDIFIAKYDSNGNYVWAKNMGGTGNDGATSLALDSNRQPHITGYFNGTADFDPSAAAVNLTSAGAADGFIAKYDANGGHLWVKAIGGTGTDMPMSLALSSNGQVHIAGKFEGTADFDPSSGAVANLTSGDSYDIFIAKYDANGNYLWAKGIGGWYKQVANSIALDSSGRVYVTGYFDGTVDFDPSSGAAANLTSAANDIFIAKYDANGNYLWAKGIGGRSYIDDAEATSIALDNTGQVYIAGQFEGEVDFDPSAATTNLLNAWGKDAFMAKYDANGNYIWAKIITGQFEERIAGLALDSNGQPSITGYFMGTDDFDPSTATVNLTSGTNLFNSFVASYTTNGLYRNALCIGGYPETVPSLPDSGKVIATDNLGNVYVAGAFNGRVDFDPSVATAELISQGTNSDAFIAKYDANGNYLWAKRIGGNGSEMPNSLVLDSSGRIYIAGNFTSTTDFDPSAATATITPMGLRDIFIAKYDANGNYLWAKSMGGTGSNSVNAIALDSGGRVYIAGSFASTVYFDPYDANANITSVGSADIFFAKFDAYGNYIWAKSIGGINSDAARAIALDNSGQVYITGSFSNTVDFDPSEATANIVGVTSGDRGDIFFAKYDTNGNYIWAKHITGSGFKSVASLALDSSNQIYITGYFGGTPTPHNPYPSSVDFDPSPASYSIYPTTAWDDAFIAKYNTNGGLLWVKRIGGNDSEIPTSLAVDSSGKVYVTGYFLGTADFDPSAATANIGSLGAEDSFIAKYDTNGGYLWAKSMGGVKTGYANSLALGSSGQIYVIGNFSGTVDFNPSSVNTNLTASNNVDLFIAKYKECPLPSTMTLSGATITANATAETYQWIDCDNNSAIIPEATSQSFTPSNVNGNYAVIITTNGCSAVSDCVNLLGVKENIFDAVVLYPNPTSSNFTIKLPAVYSRTEFCVTDMLGKTIKKGKFNDQTEFNLNIEEAADGIYFVELKCEDVSKTFKIIKRQ